MQGFKDFFRKVSSLPNNLIFSSAITKTPKSPTKMKHSFSAVHSPERPDNNKSIKISELDSFKISRSFSFESMYSIENFLAQGSFGEVHQVVEREGGRDLAMKSVDLKESHENECETPVIVQRNRPTDKIIKIEQYFRERGQLIIVLDLMKGCDMLDFMMDVGKFPENFAKKVTKRTLLALKDCHDAGVAHLDVKPDNLMFRNEFEGEISIQSAKPEELVLVDFGSARIMSEEEELLTLDQGTGTVGYVAPEVLKGRASTRSDMWSVGVLYVRGEKREMFFLCVCVCCFLFLSITSQTRSLTHPLTHSLTYTVLTCL